MSLAITDLEAAQNCEILRMRHIDYLAGKDLVSIKELSVLSCNDAYSLATKAKAIGKEDMVDNLAQLAFTHAVNNLGFEVGRRHGELYTQIEAMAEQVLPGQQG